MTARTAGAKLFPLLPVLAILSCDQREHEIPTSPAGGATLAPRIAMSGGGRVVEVDSVRIVVALDGRSTAFKDTTVAFSQGSLQVRDVPVDAHYTISARGLKVASDHRHVSVWWQGSRSGIATVGAAPQHWDSVLVALGDTASPSLAGTGLPASGDRVLPFGSSSDTIRFQIPAVDSAFLDGRRLVADSNSQLLSFFTVVLPVPGTSAIQVASPSGNVSVLPLRLSASTDPKTDPRPPSISFLSPSRGDTVFREAVDSCLVQVSATSASGIDSVVFASGRWRERLVGAPWKVMVPLGPGGNQLLDTIFASNGKIAVGSATLANPLLAGDAVAPSFRRILPAAYSDTVEWSVLSARLSWRVWDSSGVRLAWVAGQVGSIPGADSVWSTDLPLHYGMNLVRIHFQDNAGNSDSDSVAIFRSSPGSAPRLIRSFGPGDTLLPAHATSVQLGWVASAPSGIQFVSVNGVVAGTSSSGLSVERTGTVESSTIRADALLASDSTVLTLSIKDSTGKTFGDVVTVRVAQAPSVHRTTHLASPDSVLDSTSIHPRWTVARTRGLKSVLVEIDGQAGEVSCAGTDCVADLPLGVGSHLVSLRAVDSARDTALDTFTVVRRNSITVPVITWKGANRDHRDTLPYGTASWTPRWEVLLPTGWTVLVQQQESIGDHGIHSATLNLRSAALGYDTFAVVAAVNGGASMPDTAWLHVSADTNRPAISRSGAVDFVVPDTQRTLPLSWSVVDPTLGSAYVDDTLATCDAGVCSRAISLAGRSASSWIRFRAVDSTGRDAFDSVRVRRLGKAVLSPRGGTFAGATTPTLSAPIDSAVVDWSFDGSTWNAVGTTIHVDSCQKVFTRSRLGGVTVLDTAVFFLKPTISTVWDSAAGHYTVTLSARGADSVEYTDWASYSKFKRYSAPFLETSSQRITARARLGGAVSELARGHVLFPAKFVQDPSGSFADTLDLEVDCNGTCDSMRIDFGKGWKSIPGAIGMVSFSGSSTVVRTEAYLDGEVKSTSGTFRISHDTTLLFINPYQVISPMNVKKVDDSNYVIVDSFSSSDAGVYLQAFAKDAYAKVTLQDGLIPFVGDSVLVPIVVTNHSSRQTYYLRAYRKPATTTSTGDGLRLRGLGLARAKSETDSVSVSGTSDRSLPGA